jgi:hypothetical protein
MKKTSAHLTNDGHFQVLAPGARSNTRSNIEAAVKAKPHVGIHMTGAGSFVAVLSHGKPVDFNT